MEPRLLSAARRAGTPLLRMQTDERLAELVHAGFDAPFELLVRRHRRALERTCRRVLPLDRVDDAVQQAFLNAHQSILRRGAPQQFEPWLHTVARNAAFRLIEPEQQSLPAAEDQIAGGQRPDEAYERRERVQATVSGVAGLPRRQREALVQHALEGRSHHEIASRLGVSEGAVRQLIHRARRRLREIGSFLTPPSLLQRLQFLGEEGGTRAAELGAAAGGLTGAKVAAAVLVGGAVGSAALVPPGDLPRPHAPDRGALVAPAEQIATAGGIGRFADSGLDDRRSGSAGPDRRQGAAERRAGDNSGPGSGERGTSGSGDSSSATSGSGSGSSGSSSSGSGTSGSGSDSSGSGQSGSGDPSSSVSGTSGSGTSGSGSDSSGSSGSGSGDSALLPTIESGSGSSGSSSSGG